MSATPTEPQVQVGFVGARHPHILQRVRLLQEDDRALVVGFVEEDSKISAAVQDRLGLKQFGSLDELLSVGIDIAVVEALDPDVPRLASACIGRAKSLLIEKPGAGRPHEAYSLISPCKKAGTVVEFGYEMHYAEFMRVLHGVLESRCLGQVTLARFHGGNPVGCALEIWQSLPEDLGGLGYTEGCHLVEMVTDLFGVPGRVSSVASKLLPGDSESSPYYKSGLFSDPAEVTEVRVGTCRYEDVMTSSLVYEDKVVTIDLTAWEAGNWVEDWSVEIYGTNGTSRVNVASEVVEVFLREERAGFAQGRTVIDANHSGLGYMYERQLDSLIRRTKGAGAEVSVGLEAGMAVLRVLEAAYASAAASGKMAAVRPPL